MPNNCFGTLKITASDELLKKILDTVHGTGDDEDNPFDFNKIIPMPDYIFSGVIGPEEEKLYGKNNWYDWSCENWGTKWNSCDTELHGNFYTFWTAWSPCSPVIEKLAEMFPDAVFDYSYDESGMCFCGEEKYEGGKLVYIMEADMWENWYDEESDEPPADFEYGHEAEEKTYTEEYETYKVGRIKTLFDDVECRTETDGWFCEGKGDLRNRLEEAMGKATGGYEK